MERRMVSKMWFVLSIVMLGMGLMPMAPVLGAEPQQPAASLARAPCLT